MKSRIYFIVLIYLIFITIGVKSERKDRKVFINKCCPKGEYIVEIDDYNKTCVKYSKDKGLDFNEVFLYNEDKTKTGRTFTSVYELKDREVTALDLNTIYFLTTSEHNYYLSENGVLYEESPNEYEWWRELARDKFCIDYLLNENATDVVGHQFWIEYSSSTVTGPSIVLNIGFFISCIFLALILVVYSLLPGSRILSELIVMAYVASTFGAFFFLSIITISIYSIQTCIGLSYVTYFLLLSSFAWMVVMSYDLWSLHRKTYLGHRSSKRKVLMRFKVYGMFAWGIPAVLTIFLIITNHVNMRHIPWFTTPNIPIYSCFIDGGEKFLYLYIPMLVFIFADCILFLLTSYNLWKQFKMTAAVDSNINARKNHRTLVNRFFMYLKLFIIMGISWLLEVASYLKPDFGFWFISDYYNNLIGLSMFFVLVFNKKIYKRLKKRFESKENMPKKVSVETENY